jgi:hypothetical protein
VRNPLMILAGAAAAVAMVWLSAVLLRGCNSSTSEIAAYRANKAARKEAQAAVPTIAISMETEREIQQALRAALEVRNPGVPERARDSLVNTLQKQLVARASSSAAEYVSLAESESAKWVAPTDDVSWETIALRYDFVTGGEKPDRTQPVEALRTNLEGGLRENIRLTACGTGVHGARIIVRSTKDPRELKKPVLTSPEDVRRWIGLSTFPARFYRYPRRAPEAVVVQYGELVYAHAFLLVRDAKDRPIVFCSIWFWDPLDNAWYCTEFLAKGDTFYAVEF